jgi:hypothetical protein
MTLLVDHATSEPAIDVIRLQLAVTDRDTVVELRKFDDDAERHHFALSALKIGVLSIRQACGVVDAQSIQQECQRFVQVLGHTLSGHAEKLSGDLGVVLARYFDPQSGEFHQRLDRLIRRDGELES